MIRRGCHPDCAIISVNLLRQEKEAFGRLAFRANRSLGNWIRAACLAALARADRETFLRLVETRTARQDRLHAAARLRAINVGLRRNPSQSLGGTIPQNSAAAAGVASSR